MRKPTGEQAISSYVVSYLAVEGSVGRAASMPALVQRFEGVFGQKQVWTAVSRMELAGLIHRFLIDGKPHFTTTSCRGKVFVPMPYKLSADVADLYSVFGIWPPPIILRQEAAKEVVEDDDGIAEGEDDEEWRAT